MHTLSFFGEILDVLGTRRHTSDAAAIPCKVQLCSSKTKHNSLSADKIEVFNMDESCLFSSLVLGFAKMFYIKSEKKPIHFDRDIQQTEL